MTMTCPKDIVILIFLELVPVVAGGIQFRSGKTLESCHGNMVVSVNDQWMIKARGQKGTTCHVLGSQDLDQTLAMAGTFVGTVTYMSPERCLGTGRQWQVFVETVALESASHDVPHMFLAMDTLLACAEHANPDTTALCWEFRGAQFQQSSLPATRVWTTCKNVQAKTTPSPQTFGALAWCFSSWQPEGIPLRRGLGTGVAMTEWPNMFRLPPMDHQLGPCHSWSSMIIITAMISRHYRHPRHSYQLSASQESS